jgi:hypothetical protein
VGGGHSGAVLRPLGGPRAGGDAAAAVRRPASGQRRHLSQGERPAHQQADTCALAAGVDTALGAHTHEHICCCDVWSSTAKTRRTLMCS